ncbi:unnamed protein product [Medioppia subpectinata]|uniref:Nose resistant-to-fluoxetine protein N-terminal domain-containing protein n=1 Tax=Medioppia subpectinata TaxID=1979941 RepID=A0A7R9PWB8_9ACAR|nr:unnamed protein product [Medioppia subpectinata]CAG2103166.1 unnamed protein product [Medioppia subpectinata]
MVKGMVEKRFNISDSFDEINNNAKYLHKFYASIESNIRPVKHKLKASALQFMYSMDITSDCLDSLFKWFEALQRNELWAYQIFDSMGKLPSGLSDGVITSFGDYDQCLAVKSGPQMNTKTIYGKYCLVKPF